MSRGAWIAVGVLTALWVFLLALVLVAFAAIGDGDGRWEERTIQGRGDEKIAVVRISGSIHGGESDPSLFGVGGTGSDDAISQLQQAARDDDVAALILRVDSPGGAVVAADEIAREVQRVRRRKPVVASMADLAASGGYYVASQAARVVANPGTITGSIGVIAILPNLEGTASKLGIRPVVLKAGAQKDVGSPFRAMTPADRALYQRLLDEAHTQFIASVAQGRGMSAARVRALADGRPFSGRQARANGLVDELGDLDRAYAIALDLADVDRDDSRLVELRARRGLSSLFPFGARSPVEDVKRELGVGLGLQYLYQP